MPLIVIESDQNKGLTFGFASLCCEHGSNNSNDNSSTDRYHDGSVFSAGYEVLKLLELLVHNLIIPHDNFNV